MSYHSLSECTLTADERQAEAIRIADILTNSLSKMSQKEREFVLLMGSAHVNVSTKQIFWMRDLRDKYL
jgi:hypothetical protein